MIEEGVTIGFREIYDKLLEVGASVDRLNERVERLEEKSKEADKLEDVSHTALQTANTALSLAKDIQNNQRWLWRTILGAIIVTGIGLASNYLFKGH